MARHGTTHWDVAAYALGVLDPREVLGCEAHLAECESCAAELETLLPATKLLADVDLDSLREAEESQLIERLADAVRTEREHTHRRHRLLAAAGTTVAAAVAGFALFAGASWLSIDPAADVAGDPPATAGPTPGISPGIGGPDQGGGEQALSATDPDSGAHAEVLLESVNWGTNVSFALTAVAGPLECQLLVIRADGTVEVVGSWQVPEDGYGTPAQPEPLLLQVPTATDRADLAQLQVRATAPDGSVTTLVAVPV